jgi:phage repressor protein C with HTH and peptisase S24 domain
MAQRAKKVRISRGRGRSASEAVEASRVGGSAAKPSTETTGEAALDPITIGARIAEARGRRTQAEFADVLGVHEGTLGRYERGERLPDAEFINLMSARADINPLWLLYGDEPRGFMDAAERKPLAASGSAADRAKRLGAARVEQPRAGYVYLPLYDVRAGAGAGTIVDGEPVVDALAFKEEWIRQELRTTPEDLRLIYVSGDSMEPDLRAGDIILIDHTDTHASREGIYVLRLDDALLVKQLQRLPGGMLRVISRNSAYEPFTIPLKQLEEPNGFAIIGRVVWACRRF